MKLLCVLCLLAAPLAAETLNVEVKPLSDVQQHELREARAALDRAAKALRAVEDRITKGFGAIEAWNCGSERKRVELRGPFALITTETVDCGALWGSSTAIIGDGNAVVSP